MKHKAVPQRVEILADGFHVALSALCAQVVRNAFGRNKTSDILKEKATNAEKERSVRKLRPHRQILEQDGAEEAFLINAHRLGIGKGKRIRKGADFQISAKAFAERSLGASAFNKLAEGHREHPDFDMTPALRRGEIRGRHRVA